MMKRLTLLALFSISAVACTKAAPNATTPATTTIVAEPEERPTPSADDDRQQRVRAELAAARRENLQRLEAYAREGAFPRNRKQPGLLNVFQDEEGHLCAVANLIHLDGHTDLIASTVAADNFIVLANVSDGPLHEWILNSGFTQEEIGMIQVPYMGEFDVREEPVIEPTHLAEVRAQEVERLRTALLQVHRNISENSAVALDLAVERRSAAKAIAFAQPPK